MDLWTELERRIRDRGFRVEERLALLARLREGGSPAEEGEAILERVRRAAEALRREAAG